ncbi:hypothetical protein ABVK25_002869 [Lepraria finkii]|uniref:Protein-tyrosine-phosphatase n=1 Tax=Lepraria finkii TaxID=1340010 RepID=A0ABR4BHC5_9LECA
MFQNVGMSSCCLSGKVHQGKQAGREDEIGGLSAHVSGPSNGSKEKTIVFICDSMSQSRPVCNPLSCCFPSLRLQFPPIRLLADEYAKAGFYCYVTDFPQGDSLDISFLQNLAPRAQPKDARIPRFGR